MNALKALLGATAICGATAAYATDLEVTHWWTSGGESAAVNELAKAFDASGDHWVDGAIAGGGDTARSIIIPRILAGEPMGATQLNHGRQAEDLIKSGYLLDLTDVAEAEGWRDVIHPISLLDACTFEGKVYCAPLNIHSWQWLWVSHKAYKDAGVPVPTNWDEFAAAAPALKAAGKIPLAMGQQSWQSSGAFGVMMVALGGVDTWKAINVDRNPEAVMSPEATKVFEAFGAARDLSDGSNANNWNEATALVISGDAGGQIMGDWAQGDFQVAGQVAGTDYSCLPGLGVNKILDTGGDAFYFPVNDDPAITAAQKKLAALLVSKEVQVAFNLKKGSLPIRGDVDLALANDCMKQGLEILAGGNILPAGTMLLSEDIRNQLNDLTVEFWSDKSMLPADFQTRYSEIIATAD